ncbi:MAG: hypothetical protein AAF441_24400 [Pseudomonadota bacterium]
MLFSELTALMLTSRQILRHATFCAGVSFAVLFVFFCAIAGVAAAVSYIKYDLAGLYRCACCGTTWGEGLRVASIISLATGAAVFGAGIYEAKTERKRMARLLGKAWPRFSRIDREAFLSLLLGAAKGRWLPTVRRGRFMRLLRVSLPVQRR